MPFCNSVSLPFLKFPSAHQEGPTQLSIMILWNYKILLSQHHRGKLWKRLPVGFSAQGDPRWGFLTTWWLLQTKRMSGESTLAFSRTLWLKITRHWSISLIHLDKYRPLGLTAKASQCQEKSPPSWSFPISNWPRLIKAWFSEFWLTQIRESSWWFQEEIWNKYLDKSCLIFSSQVRSLFGLVCHSVSNCPLWNGVICMTEAFSKITKHRLVKSLFISGYLRLKFS